MTAVELFRRFSGNGSILLTWDNGNATLATVTIEYHERELVFRRSNVEENLYGAGTTRVWTPKPDDKISIPWPSMDHDGFTEDRFGCISELIINPQPGQARGRITLYPDGIDPKEPFPATAAEAA